VAPYKPFATEAGKQSQYLHHPGQHFNVQSNDQGAQCPVAGSRSTKCLEGKQFTAAMLLDEDCSCYKSSSL